MRCLVFAYSQLGHDCLKYIIEKTEHTIACVITHEDNPGEHIWFDSVKALAEKHNIDVLTPESLKNEIIQNQINAYNADILLSFYYRNMIPEAIFSKPPLGAYNMHGSLLPKYRGRCPVNWAVINGETKTGVTLHHMLKAADAGDIVDQAETPIYPDDKAGDIMQRLNGLAVNILKRSLSLIANKTAPRIMQDMQKATYFGGRNAKDGEIEWSKSAVEICNLVRALQPNPQYPAAYGLINGLYRLVYDCEILNSEEDKFMSFKPGTVTCMHGENMHEITCGKNGSQLLLIWIREVE